MRGGRKEGEKFSLKVGFGLLIFLSADRWLVRPHQLFRQRLVSENEGREGERNQHRIAYMEYKEERGRKERRRLLRAKEMEVPSVGGHQIMPINIRVVKL